MSDPLRDTETIRAAEIRKRHAAATSGPWDTSRGTLSGYVVQAREDVLWLLAENDRLVGRLQAAEQVEEAAIELVGAPFGSLDQRAFYRLREALDEAALSVSPAPTLTEPGVDERGEPLSTSAVSPAPQEQQQR